MFEQITFKEKMGGGAIYTTTPTSNAHVLSNSWIAKKYTRHIFFFKSISTWVLSLKNLHFKLVTT